MIDETYKDGFAGGTIAICVLFGLVFVLAHACETQRPAERAVEPVRIEPVQVEPAPAPVSPCPSRP